jgi:elongation factor 1 alpha-like protein
MKPSPNDIPSGLKSKQATAKSAGQKKPQADLAEGLKALSVEETVKVKSKNLDVLAEYKKSQQKKAANFVVIGMLDAIVSIPSTGH